MKLALAIAAPLVLVVGLAVPASAASAFTAAPAPVISGTAAVGSTLTANTGAWSPAPDSFAYQWNRGGAAIAGATAKTYKLVTADGGATITVTVTASKAGYAPTPKTSAAKTIPAVGFTTVPVPTIMGTVNSGALLTAQTGAWSPAPTSFTYDWYRHGNPAGTGPTYTVRDADEGASLTVKVTATKPGYQTTSKTSQPLVIDIPDVIRYRQKAVVAQSTDWLLPAVRLVIAEAGVTVGYGAILRLGPGVTVKIGSGDVTVLGTLRAKGSSTAPAVLTSLKDDSTAGDTNGDGTTTAPRPNDWAEIRVEDRATIDLYKARVLYASRVLSGYHDSGGGLPDDVPDAPESLFPAMTRIESSTISGSLSAVRAGVLSTDLLEIKGTTVGGSLVVESVGSATAQQAPTRVSGNTAQSIRIQDRLIRPSYLAGNTVTGKLKSIALGGGLAEDWTWPAAGTPFHINSLNFGSGLWIAAGVTLTLPAGAVMKFAPDREGGLYGPGTLNSTATAASPAILTSLLDDSVGGDLNGDGSATLPSKGDWEGLTYVEQVLGRVEVRFARTLLKETFSTQPTPRIVGSVSAGATLTAETGGWGPTPTSFSYQWRRNDAVVGTASSYTIQDADDGRQLSVTVTAARLGYASASKTSAPLAVDLPDVLRLSGSITSNADWIAPAVRVVILESTVTVENGATVRIGPGVIVKAGVVKVSGALRAAGSTANPVVITARSDDTVAGDTNGDGAATIPMDDGSDGGLTAMTGATLDLYKVETRSHLGVSGGSSYFIPAPDSPPTVLRIRQSTIDGGVSFQRTVAAETIEVAGNIIGDNASIDSQATAPTGLRFVGNRINGAAEIRDLAFLPDQYTGNSFAGSGQYMTVTGTLGGNWTATRDTPPFMIGRSSQSGSGLRIPSGVTLTLAPGSVLKFFGPLTVAGSLVSMATPGEPAVLTSANDRSVGTDVIGGGTSTPSKGDWPGIQVERTGLLRLADVQVRYAALAVPPSPN